MDSRLDRVFEYTKFHVSLYTVVAGALVFTSESARLTHAPGWRLFALAGLVLAGLAGGTILGAATRHSTFETLENGVDLLGFQMRYARWATLEHAGFWFAVLVTAAAWSASELDDALVYRVGVAAAAVACCVYFVVRPHQLAHKSPGPAQGATPH